MRPRSDGRARSCFGALLAVALASAAALGAGACHRADDTDAVCRHALAASTRVGQRLAGPGWRPSPTQQQAFLERCRHLPAPVRTCLAEADDDWAVKRCLAQAPGAAPASADASSR